MPASLEQPPSLNSSLSPEGFTQFQRAIESLPAATLRSEIERLHNSTFHLRRSNAQLHIAAQEDDAEELNQYILENEDVIRSNTIKISLLQNQLQLLEPNQPNNTNSEAATTNAPTEVNGSAPNGNVEQAIEESDEGVFL